MGYIPITKKKDEKGIMAKLIITINMQWNQMGRFEANITKFAPNFSQHQLDDFYYVSPAIFTVSQLGVLTTRGSITLCNYIFKFLYKDSFFAPINKCILGANLELYQGKRNSLFCQFYPTLDDHIIPNKIVEDMGIVPLINNYLICVDSDAMLMFDNWSLPENKRDDTINKKIRDSLLFVLHYFIAECLPISLKGRRVNLSNNNKKVMKRTALFSSHLYQEVWCKRVPINNEAFPHLLQQARDIYYEQYQKAIALGYVSIIQPF